MTSSTDSESENRDRIRTLVTEVWNRRNYDLVTDLIHPDYVLHETANPTETRGVDGFIGRTEMYHAAFPDPELTIDDLVADDDRVALRWTVRGTHRGKVLGIPATGATVRIPGITVYRIEDDKVRESWEVYDTQGVKSQLGFTFPEIVVHLPRIAWDKLRALFPVSPGDASTTSS